MVERRRICVVAAAIASLYSSVARAEPSPPPPPAQVPAAAASPDEPVSPPTMQPATVAGADDAERARFRARYEPLRVRGWNVDFPLPDNTLTGDDPVRSKMADYHLGYYFYAIAVANVNMLDVARTGPNGVQLYNGQKFTTRTTPSGIINFDLGWLGLENAQLSAAFIDVQTSWDPAGPNTFGMSHLTYYQSFFKKLFELKVGYVTNNFEFYGPYVGGNLASALFGQSSSVITAMGISHTAATRPGANLQANLAHYYEKSGIQYSSSPDGYTVERDANERGFKWTIPNAHALFIEEVGYKRAATRDERQTWIRFGWLRNTSDFVDLQYGGRSTKNYAFYGMADYQLVKFRSTPSEAAGVYVGYSAHLGLDRYSRIAQTYEGRLYMQGPIASRPGDMASMIVDYNAFSIYAVEAAVRAGQNGVTGSWQATWAYNVAIVPGFTAGLGLSYADHPAPVVEPAGTGHALSLLSSFTFYL